MTVPGDLDPYFSLGAAAVASPGWALGTLCGAVLGNILPVQAVSALSVGLYGMFLAIIIPPARRNRTIAAVVAISFGLSFAVNKLSIFNFMSSGVKTIVLTIVISLTAAILFPVAEEDADE